MSALFQLDQRRRPDLFIWNGELSENQLTRWVCSNGLTVNEELFDLWRRTGGGEMFESELILAPFGKGEAGEDVLGVNALHWARGLPRDLLIVHFGSSLTAVRALDGAWLVLASDDYRVIEIYPSFSSWYKSVIHDEFAWRYGLVP